jgi:hypothetical protein
MKNRLYIYFVVLIFVGLSCKPKPDEIPKPDNLIALDTLGMIIYDVHLIDAALTTNAINSHGVYSRYNLYQSIFYKYHRTEDDFNTSIRYYVLNDIIKLHEEYDVVLSSLNTEKAELTKKLQEDF